MFSTRGSIPWPPRQSRCISRAARARVPAIATPRALASYSTGRMAMEDDLEGLITVEQAYEHCRCVAREIARTFYYGSRFLPPLKRRAAWALYAFCRTADDIADEPERYPDGAAALARWRAALEETYAGHPRGPVMVAWADLLRHFAVPLTPALELLEGCAMDLTDARYQTFDDLRAYCYRVAGTVGLLMAPVLGYHDDRALPHAVDLGIAMQLTNIVRDVGEDAARGRIYLPAAEMARHGYTHADLAARRVTPALVAMLEDLMARAEVLYASGLRGLAYLHRDARLAIALSAALYRGIHARVRRNGYDVFTRRAHVSLAGKLAAIPAAWLHMYDAPTAASLHYERPVM
ncbi:MAG TPA: phytoene/squalene synthase family protein [Ktedonobacterales bacterium]|nr:phytoene/squalene synthase family protein [Ktedonobacterales bacterium]